VGKNHNDIYAISTFNASLHIVFFRKPPADPYKAVANGNGKKKPGNKENYWIKQDQMELEPCVKKDEGIASTIPRYCYKKNNH
jgi:hypothetical protein